MADFLSAAQEHFQFAPERADESVPFPSRKGVARVERHAGRRDRGIPEEDRLLHAVLVRADADLRAGIIDAIGDDRPAVVLALLGTIDFIAATRAMLRRPELARVRMQSRALHVAMAV
ncbi:MAG TPA: hypothetical protein PKH97_14805 [Tetrasphaera sp.]|uniref:hypothetical protein n=1 Tax=Nostocoides sp. TaxID=1917966 RepID=UPI002C3802C7|nr:hypothetical protein [Tetrasphaera sp.]HNQ08444.1 hypothetical protein [Tetrasphaera sp.]